MRFPVLDSGSVQGEPHRTPSLYCFRMSLEAQEPPNPEACEAAKPVVLDTEVEGLVLHQMVGPQDDEQYFILQQANLEYWQEFGNRIDESVEAVTARRQEYGGNGRFGIWFEGNLVGVVEHYAKGNEREAEIGILLDKLATGKGFATHAVRTLVDHIKPRFDRVYAEVHRENVRSLALMRRLGYTSNGQVISYDWGEALVFETSA